MGYDPDLHHRRSIRLKDFDYSCLGAYFITICSHQRECFFADLVNGEVRVNNVGIIVSEVWIGLAERFPQASIDIFVVMPNHLHGIIVIRERDGADAGGTKDFGPIGVGAIHELPLQVDARCERISRRNMLLPKMIGYFKMNSAKKINELRNTPGIPVWQRNYYERIIGTDRELSIAREYIANNPKQWEMDKENPANSSS